MSDRRRAPRYEFGLARPVHVNLLQDAVVVSAMADDVVVLTHERPDSCDRLLLQIAGADDHVVTLEAVIVGSSPVFGSGPVKYRVALRVPGLSDLARDHALALFA